MRFVETPIFTRRLAELVIYHWRPSETVFFMLFAYGKTEQGDLTREQLRILARAVREELE